MLDISVAPENISVSAPNTVRADESLSATCTTTTASNPSANIYWQVGRDNSSKMERFQPELSTVQAKNDVAAFLPNLIN